MCAASLPAVTTVLRSDVCSTRTSTIADADICEQSSSSGEKATDSKTEAMHRQPVAAQRMLCCFLILYLQEQYVGRMLEKKKGEFVDKLWCWVLAVVRWEIKLSIVLLGRLPKVDLII